MGRKKSYESEEKLITREELMKKRGLSKSFIRNKLSSVMYDMGHRTKMYKLSEVDLALKQMRKAS